MNNKTEKKDVKDAINLIDNARMAHKEKQKEVEVKAEKANTKTNAEREKIRTEGKKKGKITKEE